MAKRAPDLRKLARRQRWLLWMVLATLLLEAVSFSGHFSGFGAIGFLTLTLGAIVIRILVLVGTIMLMVARGDHPAIVVLIGILMLAPCINLLMLLLVNSHVTRTLKAAGLHVGLMGVDPQELERIVNRDLCTHCGYNLTGNTSGVCPECGRAIDSGAFVG